MEIERERDHNEEKSIHIDIGVSDRFRHDACVRFWRDEDRPDQRNQILKIRR